MPPRQWDWITPDLEVYQTPEGHKRALGLGRTFFWWCPVTKQHRVPGAEGPELRQMLVKAREPVRFCGVPFQRFSWDLEHVVWVAPEIPGTALKPIPMSEWADGTWTAIGEREARHPNPVYLVRSWAEREVDKMQQAALESLGSLAFLRRALYSP